MTTKIDGNNGVLQSYDYQVLTTGFSYTFATGTTTLIIQPAGTLATGTITMPASPADGMVITFTTTQEITALTISGNTGQTIGGTQVALMAANSAMSFVYRLSSLTWYRNSAPALGNVGTAPVYAARAWVNFDGSANTNLTGTYTRTSPSTTLTVTATAHGLIVGSSVNLDFTTGTGLDGVYTVVTVADANTFTVTTVASTTTSGNVTLLRNTIRGSGNVSSVTDNGTGDYTVNFATAMPDANYSVSASSGSPDGSTTDCTRNPCRITSQTASAVRYTVMSGASAATSVDVAQSCVAIFR